MENSLKNLRLKPLRAYGQSLRNNPNYLDSKDGLKNPKNIGFRTLRLSQKSLKILVYGPLKIYEKLLKNQFSWALRIYGKFLKNPRLLRFMQLLNTFKDL